MEINVIAADDDLDEEEENDDDEEKDAEEFYGWDEDDLMENEEAEEDFDEIPLNLSEDASDLKHQLQKLISRVPERHFCGCYDNLENIEFPLSYRENTKKELKLLDIVNNFRRQYIYIYPDRKPLLLIPVNECGIEKFVCSTVKLTCLPYKQLYNWPSIVQFVSDYVDYIQLEKPYLLPKRMLSPSTVLSHAQGNCFEISTLLVSLLIGAGYDAYVVSGYATVATCHADLSYDACPLLQPGTEPAVEDRPTACTKYRARAPRLLQSKYIKMMEDRKLAEAQRIIDAQEAEELARIMAEEQPPDDVMFGQRIHAWVLVLPGKRDVTSPFFIEAVTGRSQPVNTPLSQAGTANFLGIESVWNDKNYWVNMQDCSTGIEDMVYDLNSCEHWEFMLVSNVMPSSTNKDLTSGNFDDDDDENEDEIEIHPEPVSWVPRIILSPADFHMQYPGGHKVKIYKRARVDFFAPYCLPDGLICRLTEYEDFYRTLVRQIKDSFEHRADKLRERCFNFETGWIIEHYQQGSLKGLKEHHFLAVDDVSKLSDRCLDFYTNTRADGLRRQITTPISMSLYFENRDDFLVYAHVDFTDDVSKAINESAIEVDVHGIWKMVLHFARNESKPADEDVRELVFDDSTCCIMVRYQCGNSRISFATRDYIKLSACKDPDAEVDWMPDNYLVYQILPNAADLKMVDRYLLLLHLLKLQKKYRSMMSSYEQKLKRLLLSLREHDVSVILEVSVYDRLRDTQAKKYRDMLDRMELEERLRRQEVEADYMGPFLAYFNNPANLTVDVAQKLREMCLTDCKQRLINRAEIIQATFEREREEVVKKQGEYQKQQSKLNEAEYVAFSSEAKLRLHVAELRLNRHKDMAPYQFMALDQRIRSDPRFASYFVQCAAPGSVTPMGPFAGPLKMQGRGRMR